MTRILSLFVMFMLTGVMAFAQNRTVTGTVLDDKGAPVEGATISIGNRPLTQTDQQGNYRISNVAPNANLTVTFTGVAPQTLAADDNTVNFRITRTGGSELNTVVVTALGRRQLQSRLGAATATVQARELTQAAPVNLVNGLTAKVSGLTIQTTNSGVFGETKINFRGIRSLTGSNTPLLVIDGAQVSLGFLNSLNPNDVENVSLLKSASAATIYGPDAVNGVIVITTKRGRVNRPQINVSHSIQFEKVSYLPEFQNTYGSGYNQDADGNGTFEAIEQQSWGDPFDGSIRQFGQDGPNGEQLLLPYSYVANGRRNFFNTGTVNQTDVSYSTGDLFLSAQNAEIRGTVPGDERSRRAFNVRMEKTYNRFRAGFSGRYTNTQYNATTANTLIYYGITSAPGQYDLSRFSDWRNDYFSSPDGYYTPYLDNNGKTPYFAKDNNRQDGRGDDFIGNADFNYRAADWLNFTYRAGGTLSNTNAEITRGAYQRSAFAKTLRDPAASDITAAFTSQTAFSTRLTSDFFVTINKRFGKFGLNPVFGYSYRQLTSRSQSIGSDNLGFTDFLSIASRLGEPTVGDSRARTALDRFFGTVNLDWNETIFVELAASLDRESRVARAQVDFPSSDISLFYPGVNTSILVHKLVPALVDNNVLSFFKIRGAYNRTGNANAIGAYQNDVTFGQSTFFPFGSTPGFTQSTTFVPTRLSPEFVKNREVGVELGFLKNRLTLEAGYYNQKNTGQILNLSTSNTTGFTQTQLNAADFNNFGYEIDLKLTPLVKLGAVDINVKANYTKQDSKVTRLVDGVNELAVGNLNYVIVGQPVYKFRLTDYIRDDQGRVIVGTDGMPTRNPNLSTFGRTLASDIVGMTLGVNWKAFALTAVGEYRGGNQIVVDQLGAFLDDNGVSKRSADFGRRAFIFPNSSYDDGTGKFVPNTDRYTQTFGRLFYNSALNTGVQTNYLASGAFWKLREVSFTYTLPQEVLRGKTIKGVTFGVTGRNLLTFLPDSNQWTDPEFNNTSQGNTAGRSTAFNLPPTRNFGASVSFTF